MSTKIICITHTHHIIQSYDCVHPSYSMISILDTEWSDGVLIGYLSLLWLPFFSFLSGLSSLLFLCFLIFSNYIFSSFFSPQPSFVYFPLWFEKTHPLDVEDISLKPSSLNFWYSLSIDQAMPPIILINFVFITSLNLTFP